MLVSNPTTGVEEVHIESVLLSEEPSDDTEVSAVHFETVKPGVLATQV